MNMSKIVDNLEHNLKKAKYHKYHNLSTSGLDYCQENVMSENLYNIDVITEKNKPHVSNVHNLCLCGL